MHCTACKHENPVQAKFCLECGAALVHRCAQCQVELPVNAKFCIACGVGVADSAKVEQPSTRATAGRPFDAVQDKLNGAPEGERRQLTVLFCDLVGSTELAARLDPEDWRDVVTQYQRTAAEAVRRFDGYVARYLGDGLLVYFGYPQAHDDDPERAVRAGLAILGNVQTLNGRLEATRGLRLAVRVGMHTGGVVVGPGEDAVAEVFGDTPNVAARLQAVASPDTVVISVATLHLVRGIFVIEDLGPQILKGIAQPVSVYRVVQPSGVRSRLEVHGVRHTPLVGRHVEVGVLLDRWERVQERQGQTILITGEPGVGKSRLAYMLRERLANEPHTWLECRCSPYTQHSAFRPVIELVEQGVAFWPNDTPADKIAKLKQAVRLAGFSLPDTVPLLAEFLSIPVTDTYTPAQLSPDLQRKKLLEALVAWGLRLGEMQPALVLFEDLQWCDPSSLELLARLIEQCATTRVMIVLTARQEFESPWPARSNLTPIRLSRLTSLQTQEMLAALSPDRPLPEAIVDMISARADGIPLYVEEVARMVLESGLLVERGDHYELTGPTTDLAIPTTLQGSLMARLDRLSAAKEVVQRAAALGREFPYALLEAVAGLDKTTLRQGLARLVEAELLFQRGTPPDATYTFKHALIQDAAHQSLLRRTRQTLHARIAEVLEERFPDRVETEPEVLARHFEEAGAPARAIPYRQRAGERAIERSAHAEAIAHLRKGIELLSALPEGRERSRQELMLQVALGSPLMASQGYSSPEVEGAYRRARELSQEAGDAPQLFRALWGLAAYYQSRAELGVAREIAAQLLELARRAGERELLLLANVTTGATSWYEGAWTAALPPLEQAVRLYDPDQDRGLAYAYGQDPGMIAVVFAAICHWHLGCPDSGLPQAEAALEQGKRSQLHPLGLAFALGFLAVLHFLRREGKLVRRRASEAMRIAEEHGFAVELGLARLLYGWSLTDAGEVENGMAAMQRAWADLSTTNVRVGAPLMISVLASGQANAGRIEDALSSLELALELSKRQKNPSWDPELLRMKGELLARCEASGVEAEGLFRAAIDLAHAQGSRMLELRAATSLGRVLRGRGAASAARALVSPLYAAFTEGLDTQDLQEAKALLELP